MKKSITLLLVISFLLVFTGCKKNNQTIDFNNLDESTKQTTYLEKPTSGRPKSQEPIDNIFIALNNLKQASYYESETTGEIAAKKAITLATQQLKSTKIITPNASFCETTSVSKFLKLAEQLYITKNNILKRDPNKIVSSGNISWKNNAYKLTQETFLKEYGVSFAEPTKYIINKETITSDIEIINNGIGRKYTYKFSLDPQIASYLYQNTILKLSGSTSKPKFKSIEMTMTFDYKWRMSKIEINEVYEITMPALGTVTCHASLIETFKNFEKHITIEESSFFEKQL